MFIRRPSDLGDLVRATRQARGLNQEELATRLGVSRWWVNGFEGGKPTARLDLVLRALNELQITLSASTDDVTAEADPRPTARRSAIDIDEIATTGLNPPSEPLATRGKRRRR